ncbi:MAG: AraC family transcriptional regulator [Verrucomicrobiota bacterium]|nr:AraC family transcriptional regulator [Verrucomicrobiota bacterium]
MTGLIYRYAWDAPRKHDVEFAVYSHAVEEKMPAGLLHYTAHVDDWLLIYFHDVARFEAHGEWKSVPPGHLVVWAPGQARSYGNADGEWTHSWIQVTGRRVLPLLKSVSISAGTPWRAGGPQLIEHGIRQMHTELTTPANPSTRILGNCFENWLLMLARDANDPELVPNRRLRSLKSLLDMQTGTPLTLQAMASIAGISPSHLSALFRKTYGHAPVTYHILRRIDAARYLLVNRSISISEVADRTGYPDLQAFSRMFKRVVGVSPRAYREQTSQVRMQQLPLQDKLLPERRVTNSPRNRIRHLMHTQR